MSEPKQSEVGNPPALDVRIGCPPAIDPGRTLPTIDLLSPLTIEGVTFRNRIAAAPACHAEAQDGRATEAHLAHLASRAAGGAGMVVVPAVAVLAEGRHRAGGLGLWSDDQVEPLARIAQALEAENAVAGIQLDHAGPRGEVSGARPSSLDPPALTEVATAFGLAARRAVRAGFRVVEIQMARGGLLHSFLSPLGNDRTDAYGGSPEGRMRLALEVVAAVRAELPAWSPPFVRIAATDWVEGGWDLAQSVVLARAFCLAGVKIVVASSGGLAPSARVPVGPGYQVPFAATLRREAGVGTAAAGRLGDPRQANAVITSGSADLVVLGRASLDRPDWPALARQALRSGPPVGLGDLLGPKS